MLVSLFSLFSCLIDIFITGLCLYASDACLLWMNFNIVFCWIWLNILCIFVLFCLWFSYYFAHECIPCLFPKFTTKKKFQKPLNFVYFIEFYLRLCRLVSLALETISGTNTPHIKDVESIVQWCSATMPDRTKVQHTSIGAGRRVKNFLKVVDIDWSCSYSCGTV